MILCDRKDLNSNKIWCALKFYMLPRYKLLLKILFEQTLICLLLDGQCSGYFKDIIPAEPGGTAYNLSSFRGRLDV